MKDALTNLSAVTLARYEEMNTPPYPGQEAVLKACELFLAVAVREAARIPDYLLLKQND
jgi:hypothetical protein